MRVILAGYPKRETIDGREIMSSQFKIAMYIQVEVVNKHLDIYFKPKGEINTRNKI